MRCNTVWKRMLVVFLLIFVCPVWADDVEMIGCSTQYVELDRGLTLLEVCRSADVEEDRRIYAQIIAYAALPMIEDHYGSPYEFDFMHIELGHNHSGGVVGYVENGGGGSDSTIDWLMVHEMIHSFWHSFTSTSWLAEGTANHGALRIHYELFGWDPDPYLRDRRNRVWEDCVERGFEDILLKDTDDNYPAAARLGDVFMIDLYFLMGPDRFDAAYQDLYTEKLADWPVDERDFARAFIRHCPEAQKCEMWEMFVDRMDDSFYFLFNLFLCQYAALSIFAVLIALLLASILIMLRRTAG